MDAWRPSDRLLLTAVILGAVVVRLLLLPTQGLRGDIDQFVGWVHHIALNGLATLYDGTDAGPVTFGPVMAYIWAVLAAIEPAFATVTDASDPWIRALMKVPASLADLGLAAVIVVALRDRPLWAALGALTLLFVPAVPYVSAWWGQYESIFALAGLGALVAASRGRNWLAAVLVAVAVATKPQAVAFIVPFAAWFWATGGIREVARAGLIGLATLVVLWLPFIPAGGPLDYLANLATYQNEVFNVLSLRAWNPWWILQVVTVGGDFIRDDVAIIGPITFRHIGYAVTALLSLVIAVTIVRDPRPRTLVLGTAASVLVIFVCMTQMHERYAYAALIALVLLLPERRVAAIWVLLAVVMTLNLVAAVPPTPDIGELLPVDGALSIVGSVAMVAIAATTITLARERRRA